MVALAAVVFPEDVETIHHDLEQGCKQLQGFHYQAVIPTGCTSRRAAIEMAAKYA